MFDFLVTKLILLGVLMVSLTVHELSHGLAAYALGDKSIKGTGRLSLNPLRHIDWLGFILLVIVGFGWAKPVMVNARYFKNPKQGMALCALAGPVSNILLAFISTILLICFYDSTNMYVLLVLQLFVQYNCVLAMFNFLPIPPLDGSKVVGAFFPNGLYIKYMMFERFGFIILILLSSFGALSPLLHTGVNNLMDLIFKLAYGVVNYASNFF